MQSNELHAARDLPRARPGGRTSPTLAHVATGGKAGSVAKIPKPPRPRGHVGDHAANGGYWRLLAAVRQSAMPRTASSRVIDFVFFPSAA